MTALKEPGKATSKADEICQKPIQYTTDPDGQGSVDGYFYCILSKGHDGPDRIFTPADPIEEDGDNEDMNRMAHNCKNLCNCISEADHQAAQVQGIKCACEP